MPKACCAPRTWRCFAPRSSAAIASRSTVRRCTTPPRSASASSSRCGARSRSGELLLMYQPQVALHTFEATHARGAAALAQARRAHRHGHRVHSRRGEDRTHPRAHRLDPAHRGRRGGRAGARRAGTAPASAINVSPPQFFESDFVEHVARTLEVTGLPPSALELEITETVFQTGAATIESLRRLRALGVADGAR